MSNYIAKKHSASFWQELLNSDPTLCTNYKHWVRLYRKRIINREDSFGFGLYIEATYMAPISKASDHVFGLLILLQLSPFNLYLYLPLEFVLD